MTDREILKEIVEIQQELVINIMRQVSLQDQEKYYIHVADKINKLLEKLTNGEQLTNGEKT